PLFGPRDDHLVLSPRPAPPPVEGIAMSNGNRIILMIVTARATDRKALSAPKDHIETVVDDVGFAALELPAQGQEAERGQVGVVMDSGLMIGRDLLDEELIVRKIDVECTHGPISERVSRGVGDFRVRAG